MHWRGNSVEIHRLVINREMEGAEDVRDCAAIAEIHIVDWVEGEVSLQVNDLWVGVSPEDGEEAEIAFLHIDDADNAVQCFRLADQ
ncbi:hypothetical protein HOI83_00945 [Candidatus Uhrbacteria bacterium]|nr:hypothetical protein [Candidatus Uhrbacteria bacterium]